ncbi:hypothetical protein [Paenibacillus algorifonticola]|nr:hypothetical protein [Paenibacillus algorifonticola]
MEQSVQAAVSSCEHDAYIVTESAPVIGHQAGLDPRECSRYGIIHPAAA